MINTCPICNKVYERTECEFCQRIARFETRKREIAAKYFPKRTCRELFEFELEETELDFVNLYNHPHGLGLFFYGKVGSGKTLRACSIMFRAIRENYINRDGLKFGFIYVPRLFYELKRGFKSSESDETDWIHALQTVDWLILDDIGIEKVSDWSLNVLLNILNYRYGEELTTIITSNYDLDELSCRWNHELISSRIAGMCDIIESGDTDYRIKG